jgi:hypothetical protein
MAMAIGFAPFLSVPRPAAVLLFARELEVKLHHQKSPTSSAVCSVLLSNKQTIVDRRQKQTAGEAGLADLLQIIESN